jgi:membrane-associated protein
MEFVATLNVLDLFTNLKGFMDEVIRQYGLWTYLVLFVIIFCETGLVVMPVLPGDSLLFLAGVATAASTGPASLDLSVLLPILFLAPLCGDSTNYWIGRYVGPKIFHKEKVRFLNREHLDRAHRFYEKHGGKAVAIGRFLPIIRTFVPFVAGIGRMSYPRFLAFSIVGTLAWISLCVLAGHFFGTVPFIQNHFEFVIVAIIVISLIPAVVAYLHSRRKPAAKTETKP